MGGRKAAHFLFRRGKPRKSRTPILTVNPNPKPPSVTSAMTIALPQLLTPEF
jgi:hypothetical protein